MIHSMTGYALVEKSLPAGMMQLELRSVNHRYLDIALRLPDELRSLEQSLREQLGTALKRGKVECRISLNPLIGEVTQRLAINEALLTELTDAVERISKLAPQSVPFSAIELLRWPGVLQDSAIDPHALKEPLTLLLREALIDFNATRHREGEKLHRVMSECCTKMTTLVSAILPQLPAIQKTYIEKLGQKLREAEINPDDERLRQELALFINRVDVSEEVARLETHLSELKRVLSHGGAVGKRVDFLLQELNREANTLGAKAADISIAQTAVELKVLIEQMREQVQNIE